MKTYNMIQEMAAAFPQKTFGRRVKALRKALEWVYSLHQQDRQYATSKFLGLVEDEMTYEERETLCRECHEQCITLNAAQEACLLRALTALNLPCSLRRGCENQDRGYGEWRGEIPQLF